MPISYGLAQTEPAWRSDGQAITWVASGYIYKATIDRSTVPYTVSGVTKVYFHYGSSNPAASYPTWSPNGTKIYFGATNGGIRYVSASGGNSSPLVSTSAKESQPSYGATLLAYTRKTATGTDIWTVDPDEPVVDPEALGRQR